MKVELEFLKLTNVWSLGLLICISENLGLSVNVVLVKKYCPRKAVENRFLPRLSFQNFPCYTFYGSKNIFFLR